MKHPSTILLLLLVTIVAAVPVSAQAQRGTVTGVVLDRDGKAPLAGASVQIDALINTSDGRVVVRERVRTKTLRDGRYRFSEVYAGRVNITIIVNNEPAMSYGGDDILVIEGRETVADFDLSKAPN
jgi:hypothetical protein